MILDSHANKGKSPTQEQKSQRFNKAFKPRRTAFRLLVKEGFSDLKQREVALVPAVQRIE